MSGFKSFIQSEKGRNLVVLLMIIPAGIGVYILYFNENNKSSNLKENMGVHISPTDTTWNKKKDVYHSKIQKKKIGLDKKFYEFNDKIDQIQNLSESSKNIVNEDIDEEDKMEVVKSNSYNQSYRNNKHSGSYNYREEELDESESDKMVLLTAKDLYGDKFTFKNKKKEIGERLYLGRISIEQTATNTNKYIRLHLLEDMVVEGRKIPKRTPLIAIVTFNPSRVFLNISQIKIGNILIESDIDVFDSNGQLGLHISGGTGAESKNEVLDETSDEINENEELNKIPGGSGFVKRIFTKKANSVKATLNPDKVYLRINE